MLVSFASIEKMTYYLSFADPWSSAFLTPEAVDMNGRFQMQGGKNWFLPKEMNANRFFWDSHWLEIWSNHFYPSMGPNGGSVAMDSGSGMGKIYWSTAETEWSCACTLGSVCVKTMSWLVRAWCELWAPIGYLILITAKVFPSYLTPRIATS